MSELSASLLSSALQTDLADHTLRDSRGEYIAVGDLPACVSARTAAANALIRAVPKKLVTEVAEDADSKAVEKFLSSNLRCQNWSLDLHDSLDELLWGQLRKEWYTLWHSGDSQSCELDLMVGIPQPGPGANVGCRDVDFYTKVWDSPLSASSEALVSLYEMYINRCGDTVRDAELSRATRWGFSTVEGSRLTCVPKNDTISRTICVEPTLNMMFQQVLSKQMTALLRRRYGLNLSDQQFYNRSLAYYGSLVSEFDILTYATIDLESASDSISLPMLSALCGDNSPLLTALKMVRSPYTEVQGGERVKLWMVGSMGNATTFPLQTALFAAMCRTVATLCGDGHALRVRPTGITYSDPLLALEAIPGYGVFGDDIIVKKKFFPMVIRLLRICGFIVNRDKTFHEGPFRESCGVDAWQGVDVRPVYPKDLGELDSRAILFNSYFCWSIDHGIPLWSTLKLLLESAKGAPVVPLWEKVDAGLRVPLTSLSAVSGMPVLKSSSGLYRYHRFERKSRQLRLLEDQIVGPKWSVPRGFNASGVLDSVLNGGFSGGKVSLRLKGDLVTKARIAPNWEFAPSWNGVEPPSESSANLRGYVYPLGNIADVWNESWHAATLPRWELDSSLREHIDVQFGLLTQ